LRVGSISSVSFTGFLSVMRLVLSVLLLGVGAFGAPPPPTETERVEKSAALPADLPYPIYPDDLTPPDDSTYPLDPAIPVDPVSYPEPGKVSSEAVGKEISDTYTPGPTEDTPATDHEEFVEQEQLYEQEPGYEQEPQPYHEPESLFEQEPELYYEPKPVYEQEPEPYYEPEPLVYEQEQELLYEPEPYEQEPEPYFEPEEEQPQYPKEEQVYPVEPEQPYYPPTRQYFPFGLPTLPAMPSFNQWRFPWFNRFAYPQYPSPVHMDRPSQRSMDRPMQRSMAPEGRFLRKMVNSRRRRSTYETKPYESKSYAYKSEPYESKSYAPKPSASKSYESKPYAPKPYASKPYASKPFGEPEEITEMDTSNDWWYDIDSGMENEVSELAKKKSGYAAYAAISKQMDHYAPALHVGTIDTGVLRNPYLEDAKDRSFGIGADFNIEDMTAFKFTPQGQHLVLDFEQLEELIESGFLPVGKRLNIDERLITGYSQCWFGKKGKKFEALGSVDPMSAASRYAYWDRADCHNFHEGRYELLGLKKSYKPDGYPNWVIFLRRHHTTVAVSDFDPAALQGANPFLHKTAQHQLAEHTTDLDGMITATSEKYRFTQPGISHITGAQYTPTGGRPGFTADRYKAPKQKGDYDNSILWSTTTGYHYNPYNEDYVQYGKNLNLIGQPHAPHFNYQHRAPPVYRY
jgi:hypothetical protein